MEMKRNKMLRERLDIIKRERNGDVHTFTAGLQWVQYRCTIRQETLEASIHLERGIPPLGQMGPVSRKLETRPRVLCKSDRKDHDTKMAPNTTVQRDTRADKYSNCVNGYTTDNTPKDHGESNGAEVYGLRLW